MRPLLDEVTVRSCEWGRVSCFPHIPQDTKSHITRSSETGPGPASVSSRGGRLPGRPNPACAAGVFSSVFLFLKICSSFFLFYAQCVDFPLYVSSS